MTSPRPRAHLFESTDAEFEELLALANEPIDVNPAYYGILAAVVAEVEAHVATAKPGHEVGGLLRWENNVAVEYRPLLNLTRKPAAFLPGWFVGARTRETLGLVHSHPATCRAMPSRGDIEVVPPQLLLAPFAIWHCDSGTLGLFRLQPRTLSWTRLGAARIV